MIDFLITCVQAATPIWLAALGGLFAQRSGVLHLGLEGLLLAGAFTVVAVSVTTGSLLTGLLVAVLVNVVVSALFWTLITWFRASVIIVGLALSLAAASGTTYALVVVFGSQAAVQSPVALPKPFGGPFTVLTYGAVALSVLTWFLLNRTRWGLRVSVCGRDTFAARSAGVGIASTRLATLSIAGVLCALAGAELALANVTSFSENMSQGRGYIAFIAVLLGGVTPIGVSVAALFFGLAEGLGIESQLGLNGILPTQFVQMVPYVATIVAMVVAGAAYRRRGMALTASPEVVDT